MKDMRWVTQEGEVMKFSEMRTSHLFFSIRMIYNHSVPYGYQVSHSKQYDMSQFPPDRRREALTYLITELSKRKDLDEWMVRQIQTMRDNIAKINTRQLNLQRRKLK